MATTAAVPALVGLAEAFAAQGARGFIRSPRAVQPRQPHRHDGGRRAVRPCRTTPRRP